MRPRDPLRLRGQAGARNHLHGESGAVVEFAARDQRALFDSRAARGNGLDGAQNVGAAAEVVDQFDQPAAARFDVVAIRAKPAGSAWRKPKMDWLMSPTA